MNASVDRWRRLRRRPELPVRHRTRVRRRRPVGRRGRPGPAAASSGGAARAAARRHRAPLPGGPLGGADLSGARLLRRARSRARHPAHSRSCATAVGAASRRTGSRPEGADMTDLERRLRAALRAAAEPAPPGLFGRCMRRHRRHQVRVGASVLAVAVAAALAVPPVTAPCAVPAGHRQVTGQDVARLPTPTSRAQARAGRAGTVLSGCKALDQRLRSAATGAPSAGMRLAAVVHATAGIRPGGSGSTSPSRCCADIRPGSVVVVRVPQACQHDLRLLVRPAGLA